jgi:starvation-inducible DNA-binding protein
LYLRLAALPYIRFSDYNKVAKIKEAKDVTEGKQAVKKVLDGFSTLLEIEREILDLSSDANDEGTNALMSDYIREQEKSVWMYSAYLK